MPVTALRWTPNDFAISTSFDVLVLEQLLVWGGTGTEDNTIVFSQMEDELDLQVSLRKIHTAQSSLIGSSSLLRNRSWSRTFII